jgi:hypothetical protein
MTPLFDCEILAGTTVSACIPAGPNNYYGKRLALMTVHNAVLYIQKGVMYEMRRVLKERATSNNPNRGPPWRCFKKAMPFSRVTIMLHGSLRSFAVRVNGVLVWVVSKDSRAERQPNTATVTS